MRELSARLRYGHELCYNTKVASACESDTPLRTKENMTKTLVYAPTADGLSLPVVDVTHSAFAVSISAAELDAMSAQFLIESRQRGEATPQMMEAFGRSVLGRALMAASGTYLAGLSTYLFKLGAENLGDDAHPIDRAIAASFPGICTRIRLQDMARLLADGVLARTATHPSRRLLFINIAGGVAADSLNALIHLQRECGATLSTMEIDILVLDREAAGPDFGAGAVTSLRAPGQPLHGLAVSFRHAYYDWTKTESLATEMSGMDAEGIICAISSEGGLFEYGSDAEILANLEELNAATPPTAFVVGSVTREGEVQRSTMREGGLSLRPRTLAEFESLAQESGWELEHVLERPFSYNVRMRKQ